MKMFLQWHLLYIIFIISWLQQDGLDNDTMMIKNCSLKKKANVICYSCSTVYLVQQPDVRYSSSRPMADENTVPYIRVFHWIYSSTTDLYSDWSVCCCQNLWWTCQHFAVLKSCDQNANRGKAVVWPWASKMSGWDIPDFLFAAEKIEDLTLSQEK